MPGRLGRPAGAVGSRQSAFGKDYQPKCGPLGSASSLLERGRLQEVCPVSRPRPRPSRASSQPTPNLPQPQVEPPAPRPGADAYRDPPPPGQEPPPHAPRPHTPP